MARARSVASRIDASFLHGRPVRAVADGGFRRDAAGLASARSRGGATPPRRRRSERGRQIDVVETFLKPTGILVVNPDEVAKGLSPDTPEAIVYEAARVADTWRRDLVARGVSFCMETVFSDPHGAKLEFLKECQSQGYIVVLIFIGLDSADLSRGRVMERVEAGGHDVPDEKIDTRFPRTFTNLRQALSFVNQALLFDNSSADEPYRFVAEFREGKRRRRKGYRPAWAAFLN